MLARLRQRSALRVVAALLLSGAPRLAASVAPQPEHHCECAAHGPEHRCTCPICGAAARIARHRRIQALPPCHRAAALARAQADDAPVPPGPCVGPSCGRGDVRFLVTFGEESFTVAGPSRVPVGDPPGPPSAAPGDPLERPCAPEPPPPRA